VTTETAKRILFLPPRLRPGNFFVKVFWVPVLTDSILGKKGISSFAACMGFSPPRPYQVEKPRKTKKK
jgi:hypothetical protein